MEVDPILEYCTAAVRALVAPIHNTAESWRVLASFHDYCCQFLARMWGRVCIYNSKWLHCEVLHIFISGFHCANIFLISCHCPRSPEAAVAPSRLQCN